MKRKLDLLITPAVILIGLLITFTPFQLAPVCQGFIELKNGSLRPMACHYTGMSEVYLGITVAMIGLIMLIVKKTDMRFLSGIIAALVGLVVIILPSAIGPGICANPMMPCHVTEKVLWIWSALLIIIGLYSLLRLVQNRHTGN